jgi:hypothetical protein
MSHAPTTVSEPRTHTRTLVLFGILALVLIVGLAGGWFYLKSRANMAGLEGTWKASDDPKHSFQFRSNGNVDAWYLELPMGNFMTWQRDGQQITIHSTRGGDFVGELKDGEIRGKEMIRDNSTGKTVRTVDQVWRRE